MHIRLQGGKKSSKMCCLIWFCFALNSQLRHSKAFYRQKLFWHSLKKARFNWRGKQDDCCKMSAQLHIVTVNVSLSRKFLWHENTVFKVNVSTITNSTWEAEKPQSYVSNLFVGKQLSLLQQILVMRSFNLEPIQKE